MKKGLSVWLDVPLDALAKRIAQVGTASRPLLDQPSDDPYTAVFIFILKTIMFQFFHKTDPNCKVSQALRLPAKTCNENTLSIPFTCILLRVLLSTMVKVHAELSLLQAFTKLSMLAEQRGEAYANADARVSLEGTILVVSIFAPFMILFYDIY